MRYRVLLESASGQRVIGEMDSLDWATTMAKDYLTPDVDWVSWVVDTETGATVAEFTSHCDAPGKSRVVVA